MKKWFFSRLFVTLPESRPAPSPGATRIGVEELEPRWTPASVAPGNFSNATTGQITGPIEFDQPGTYEIVGDLTVTASGTLTVGTVAGVNVVIRDDVKLTVLGALNVNGAASFATQEHLFGDDGVAQGVVVSGTMSVTNTTLGVSGTNSADVSLVQVLTGGRLTATGAAFAGDVVAWDNASLMSAGDVTTSAFDAAIHAPAGFAPCWRATSSSGTCT